MAEANTAGVRVAANSRHHNEIRAVRLGQSRSAPFDSVELRVSQFEGDESCQQRCGE
jgi:hypothetical protein